MESTPFSIINEYLADADNFGVQHIVKTIMKSLRPAAFKPGVRVSSVTFTGELSHITEEHQLIDMSVNADLFARCEQELIDTFGENVSMTILCSIDNYKPIVDAIFSTYFNKFLQTFDNNIKVFEHFYNYFTWLTTTHIAEIAAKLPMDRGFIAAYMAIRAPMVYLELKVQRINSMSMSDIKKCRPKGKDLKPGIKNLRSQRFTQTYLVYF